MPSIWWRGGRASTMVCLSSKPKTTAIWKTNSETSGTSRTRKTNSSKQKT